MKRLIILLIAVPTLSFADKTFIDGTGAAVDCTKDPVVAIMANTGTYTFTGACKAIRVNGNSNTLTIESTDDLSVNGNKNTVTATTAKTIKANGNDNTVTYKTGKPKISNPGNHNVISGK